jgi:hypothetical protein
MESKKINQLATELTPALSDLTIIGDPTTGISKKITLSQMASLFTGTVEEYANVAAFPLVGVADTIYIALDTNVLYRWDTGLTSYVELSPNIINSLVFSDANGFDGNISLVGSVATLTITTALTQGSVPFIGTSGALTQDNANLFFDDTNNRLGINTNAPTTALDVFGSGIIGRINGTSTNNAFLGFASAGTNKWSIGNVQSDHRFRIYNDATTSELVSVLQTGEFGIGIANPTTKVHIDGGATALIANLDANVSVAKSISFRSDNSNRINLEVSGTESGSNAGANFFLRAYSDAGSLLNTPLTITRATGAATFINSVSASQFNATSKYTWGTLTDGTTGQIATDNTNNYFDYIGNLIFRGATFSGTLITFSNTGAGTFAGDLTITKASAASLFLNNTSTNGKNYRLVSKDDGLFTIQLSGVSDLLNISSSGNVGIGTSTINEKLDIEGNINIRNSSTYSTALTRTITYRSSTNSFGIQPIAGITFATVGDAASELRFVTRADAANYDTRLVITKTGNIQIDNGQLNAPKALFFQSNSSVGGNLGSIDWYNVQWDGAIRAQIKGETDTALSNGRLVFSTGGGGVTERMRIRHDGNMGIGSVGGSGTRLSIQAATSNAAIRIDADSGQSAILIGGNGNINVDYPGVSNGRFQLDGNGNVYNRTGVYGTISSDLRLKENIVEASSKLKDILKLRVVNFNLISDANKIKNIGFIAQEMQQVFPSFVYEKDTREFNEEGNVISGYEDSLGIKVGMEFAILVKCIQELKAEIDLLKTK